MPWVLYDGRAKLGDTDIAAAMDTADTEHEARQALRDDWDGYDCIWAEYDVDPSTGYLINERLRYDLKPLKQGE